MKASQPGGFKMTCFRKVLFATATVTALSFSNFASANSAQLAKIDKCTSGQEIENSGTVSGGVDGDTIHITTTSGTYSVRLLGIDTPETHFMGKSQGVWGEKAARAMAEMLPAGSKISLIFGETPCDGHGRVLAQVFKDKLHVNAEILKMGLAVNYCVAPEFRFCDDFSKYTQDSIDHGTGMYADPKVELPYDFRRRIGGNEQRSYVGNIETKEVFGPGNQDKTPIADRVFFYEKRDVKAPFHIVE
jgi:micrococcal nuclease